MPSRPAEAPKPCPQCGKPASVEHGPFCSRRCKDRDLLAWLGEAYRVPGPPAGEPGEGGLDSAPGED